MIFSYSLSLPLESRQRLYITEASTFAGLYVFGSFSSEITDRRIVLFENQTFVHRTLLFRVVFSIARAIFTSVSLT